MEISKKEIIKLRRLRKLEKLAKRWEREDEDVTIQDIIDLILGREYASSY